MRRQETTVANKNVMGKKVDRVILFFLSIIDKNQVDDWSYFLSTAAFDIRDRNDRFFVMQ